MPPDIQDLLSEANTLLAQANYPAAFKKFRLALRYQSDMPEALNGCAMCLMNTGKAEFALDFLDRAILQAPRSYGLWLNRGDCVLELGEIEAARSCYQIAADVQPKLYLCFEKLAETYCHERQFEKALGLFDRALALVDTEAGESDETTSWLRAQCLMQMGRYGEALVVFKRATNEDDNFAVGWESRGICHAKLGEPQLAHAALTRALELNPGLGEARKWKEKCEAETKHTINLN